MSVHRRQRPAPDQQGPTLRGPVRSGPADARQARPRQIASTDRQRSGPARLRSDRAAAVPRSAVARSDRTRPGDRSRRHGRLRRRRRRPCPGMGGDMNPRTAARPPDMLNNGANLARGICAATDWRRIGRGRRHGRGARRSAKAQKIECPNVESGRVQIVGPRPPAEAITHRQRGRKRRAVDVQNGIARARPASHQQRRGAPSQFKMQYRRFRHQSPGAGPNRPTDH